MHLGVSYFYSQNDKLGLKITTKRFDWLKNIINVYYVNVRRSIPVLLADKVKY